MIVVLDRHNRATGPRQPEIHGTKCRVKEVQSSIINQQFMFNLSYDLFNGNHVGYAFRHLHQYLIEKKKEFGDWQTPFEGPRELMSSE